jgi:hypothetical protein
MYFNLLLAVCTSLAGACSSNFSLLYVPQALACLHLTYLACISIFCLPYVPRLQEHVVGNGEKWRDFDGLEWRLTVEGNTTLPPVKQKTERSLCE